MLRIAPILLICLTVTAIPAIAETPAVGQLLVAHHDLRDPNFARSVVLIVVHDEEGTIGLVLNRPTRLAPEDLLPDLASLGPDAEPFFFGGPVGIDSVMILLQSASAPEESEHLFDDVFASASYSLLRDLARSERRGTLRLYLGHAGWAPGQLASELARGDWHVRTARREHVFARDTADMWERLAPPEGPLSVQHGTPHAGLSLARISPFLRRELRADAQHTLDERIEVRAATAVVGDGHADGEALAQAGR